MLVQGEFWIASSEQDHIQCIQEFLESDTEKMLILAKDKDNVIKYIDKIYEEYYKDEDSMVCRLLVFTPRVEEPKIFARAVDDNKKSIYIRCCMDEFSKALINEYGMSVAFFDF